MERNSTLDGSGDVRTPRPYPETDLPMEEATAEQVLDYVVENLALRLNEESARLIEPLSEHPQTVLLLGKISLNYDDLSPIERNKRVIPYLIPAPEDLDQTLLAILDESAQHRDAVAK